MANGWLKTFSDSFTNFGEILSISVDFLPSIFLKAAVSNCDTFCVLFCLIYSL